MWRPLRRAKPNVSVIIATSMKMGLFAQYCEIRLDHTSVGECLARDYWQFLSVSVRDELRLRRIQPEGTKWHERTQSRSLSCTLERIPLWDQENKCGLSVCFRGQSIDKSMAFTEAATSATGRKFAVMPKMGLGGLGYSKPPPKPAAASQVSVRFPPHGAQMLTFLTVSTSE